MRLVHCTHNNFGDALNRPIFDAILPKGLLDDNDEVWILGIGTIIGLKHSGKNTRRVLVFSSGIAPEYGTMPDLSKYTFLCVRGPKTADLLQLPKAKAIADGAYLLPKILSSLVPHAINHKRFQFTFVPHDMRLAHEALLRKSCDDAGIHYLSPHTDVKNFVEQILQSRVVLAEAMHAAIAADALRIPWIPVASHRGINGFKWCDFCESVQLPYEPVRLPHFFSRSDVVLSLHERFRAHPILRNVSTMKVLAGSAHAVRNLNFRRNMTNRLSIASRKEPMLSDDALCAEKIDRLMDEAQLLARMIS